MAGFGGAVKLTGESEYKKALSNIRASLREVSSEMKLLSAQYQSNDKDTNALSSKSAELVKRLNEQKKALNDLKNNYSAMSAEYDSQKRKTDELQRSYDSERAKLEQIGTTLGTTSDEYKAQQSVVDSLKQELNDNTRAQDNMSTSLSRMKTEINNAETTIVRTENTLNGLGEELQDAGDNSKTFGKEIKSAGDKAQEASSGGFTVLKGVLADLGASAIESAISGLKSLGGAIIDVGKEAISSYADYEQLVGGVETLFGTGGQNMQEYARAQGKAVGDIMDEYNNLMTAQETVLSNASQAYMTAGMSANEYMENVTSFSAALTSSLGGDTVAAANAADQALRDMSDNANKMGTDLTSITNAYQGFAKQNYTMLDNLKLGYGGTKEEMKRLLADATALSGVEYNIDNLNDVYEAIHVVQEEMGITGTTAKEAAGTISGSTGMMSAAWQNLITGIADDNSDFDSLINNFIDSVLAVADNLLPRIQTTISGMARLATSLLQKLVPQIVKTIPPLLNQTLPLLLEAVQSVIESVLEILPEVIPVISGLIPQIVSTIVSLLPEILNAGIQILMSLIQGISDTIPQLLGMLPTLITEVVTVITDNLPLIIETGINLLTSLLDGILEALPQLLKQLPIIIDKVSSAILNNLPKIIQAGVQLTSSLINGIIKALPQLLAQVPKIISQLVVTFADNFPQIVESGADIIESLVNGAKELFSNIGSLGADIIAKVADALKGLPERIKTIGRNVITGLWNGINDKISWVVNKIKGFGSTILNGIKNALGIHSPSSVFRDQVGKNIALGIGEGFSDEMSQISRDMQSEIPTLDVGGVTSDGSKTGNLGGGYDFYTMVDAFKTALSEMKVELDDHEVGSFINKTVADAIYT